MSLIIRRLTQHAKNIFYSVFDQDLDLGGEEILHLLITRYKTVDASILAPEKFFE